MNTHTHHSQAATLAHLKAIIAGTKKHFPTGTLRFGNVSMTSAELVATLQQRVDSLTALVAAQQRVEDAVLAKRASTTEVVPTIRAFHAFLHATFGSSASSLADFDLVPHKPRKKPTGEETVAKTRKAAATRQKRRPAKLTPGG